MSEELTSLETLANDFRNSLVMLSPTSQAVLYYASRFWGLKRNWYSPNPLDTISDSEWDTISAYVDGLLYEVKNPMIGLITPYATAFPPPNVLPCDGSTYLREDFPELYAVIDTIFVVDADHFIVPDLRGRTVISAGDGSGLTSRSVGDVGGEESHQLTESELASHSHTIGATITTPVLEPGEVGALTPVPLITAYTGNTGGDAAHNNMQPFYALNYGILAS